MVRMRLASSVIRSLMFIVLSAGLQSKARKATRRVEVRRARLSGGVTSGDDHAYGPPWRAVPGAARESEPG